MVGLGQFLCIMSAADQRIMPGLGQSNLEQCKTTCAFLGSFFLQRVVHCLTRASQGRGWN